VGHKARTVAEFGLAIVNVANIPAIHSSVNDSIHIFDGPATKLCYQVFNHIAFLFSHCFILILLTVGRLGVDGWSQSVIFIKLSQSISSVLASGTRHGKIPNNAPSEHHCFNLCVHRHSMMEHLLNCISTSDTVVTFYSTIIQLVAI